MTASDAHAGAAPWRVRKNTLLSALLLSVLATSGFLYVNIMPALVNALVHGLRFSERDAGFVASLNVYGAAGGAFAAVFLVARLPWRRTAVVLLLAMISADIVSMLQSTPLPLMITRLCHGLIGGLLVGVSYGVFARTASPDRTFGVLLVFQLGMAGLAVLILPGLVQQFGAWVVFVALAGFSFTTLLLLPLIPEHERIEQAAHEATAAPLRLSIITMALAFIALVLFQAANMGVAAFGIELGLHYGLQVGPVSQALGAASWISMLGSVPVIVFGVRYGRLAPVVIGMIILIGATWALHFSASLLAYFLACSVSAAAWGFVVAYLMGLCAAFDPSGGRMAALAGFFSKIGLATGPFVAGILLKNQNYDLLIDISVGVLALAGLLALTPTHLLDRAAKQGKA